MKKILRRYTKKQNRFLCLAIFMMTLIQIRALLDGRLLYLLLNSVFISCVIYMLFKNKR